MSQGETLSLSQTAPALPAWLRRVALGFAYWLAFLLLLEPGNVIAALAAGRTLAWDQEVLRIGVAALMGASVTPLLLWIVDRYPVDPTRVWRNGVVNALAAAAVAAGLIALSVPLAAWALNDHSDSLLSEFRAQMTANWPLLVYCIAAFMAAAHALRFLRRSRWPAEAPNWLTRVAVSRRGGHSMLSLDEVDWIESQGNYLALHAGGATHLIRETSARFEARLDPARFVRIHRGVLVALDRVAAVEPLEGGDATVRLRNGVELRLSRTYRRAARKRLAA